MAFTTRSIIPSHSERVDFNGDGLTDILWQHTNGMLVSWAMDASGTGGVVGAVVPDTANPKLHLRGYGDLNGDGTTDLLIQDLSGHLLPWTFQNNQHTGTIDLSIYGPLPIQAIGDFNGDGRADMLWFSPPVQGPGGIPEGVWWTGTAENRKIPAQSMGRMEEISIDFHFTGVGDFNGDGRDDILFRGSGNAATGQLLIEEPTGDGTTGVMPTHQVRLPGPNISSGGFDWNILGIADFNGDGRADLLWQHTSGLRTMWFSSGDSFVDGGAVPYPGADWSVQGVGDYNNDGRADLLWRSASTGVVAEWLMDGTHPLGLGGVFANPGDEWHVIG